jgi:hypothetical protein
MTRLILFVALAGTAFGQSPTAPPKITFAARPDGVKPTEQQARVGELVRLVSSSPKGRWELSPDAVGADLEPGTDGKAYFTADRAGRYLCVNFVGDSPAAWVVIVVGGAKPVDPPKPDPDPVKPVDPPKPQPSALAKRLGEAVAADGGLNDPNRQALNALSALVAESKEYTMKPEIATASQFVSVIATASRTIAKDAIPATRKLLITELRTLIGDSDFTLTSAKRDEIRQALTRLETALQEVTK